jgi:hypothetical protein
MRTSFFPPFFFSRSDARVSSSFDVLRSICSGEAHNYSVCVKSILSLVVYPFC